MTSVPDVRYRLSSEGVAEVVGAFKKILDESGRTSRGVQNSWGGVGGTLSSIHGLLDAVAAAAAAVSFAKLVSESASFGQTLTNLKARLPGYVADLNALDVALRRMGTSLPDVSRALTKFFETTQDASQVGGEAADKFRRLGLSTAEIKKLASLDLPQRLELVAKASKRLGDEGERDAALIGALGVRGAALIPVMKTLATQGFEGLREQARALGLDVDEETVRSLVEMNHTIEDSKLLLRGLAIQMTAGLAGPLHNALQAVESEIVASGGGWKVFGEALGQVLGWATVQIAVLGDSIATMFITLGQSLAYLWKAIKATAKGDLDTAKLEVESIGLVWKKAQEDQRKRAEVAYAKFRGGGDKTTTPSVGPTEEEAQAAADKFDRLHKAQEAKEQADRDAHVKLVQASARLLLAEEERGYARGLSSLAEYYANRRRIVTDAANVELDALRAKRAALQKSNDPAAAAELAKTTGEIKRLVLEREGAVTDLYAREADAARTLAREELAADAKVFEARGQHHRAELIAIGEETEKRRLALIAQGVPDAEQRATEFGQVLQDQSRFNELSTDANRILSAFGDERDRIRADVEAGLVSEEEGNRRILDLENQRIDSLRILGKLLLDAAGDNPERQDAARAYLKSVDDIGRALERSRVGWARFKAASLDALQSGLTDYLSEGIDKMRGLADAAVAVAQAVRRMVAEIIAAKIVGFLGSLLGGAGGTASPTFGVDSTPAGFPGGTAVGAAGAPIRFDASAFAPAAASYSSSSLVSPASSAPAAAPREVHVVLDVSPDLVLRTLESPEGQRVHVKTTERNARALRRGLGIG